MVKFYQIFLSLLTGLLLLISACNFTDRPEAVVVITIGDKSINRKELRGEIERIIFEMGITDQDARLGIKSIINKIIEKELILEYGKTKGITVSKEELEAIVKDIKQDYPGDIFSEMLLKRYIDLKDWEKGLKEELLLKKIVNSATTESTNVTFDETKKYYNKHNDEFKHPRRILVRQIVTKTKQDMEAVLDLIKKGGKMSELARDYSIAPEAENEGMLGWIAEGDLDETIGKFVFSLKRDKLSKIIESPYGFHLFKVLDEKKEGVLTLPEAMKEIEAKIVMEKRELIYKKWLKTLKTQFPVNVKEAQIFAEWDTEG